MSRRVVINIQVRVNVWGEGVCKGEYIDIEGSCFEDCKYSGKGGCE
jgi:hypothetical protein